MGQRVEILVMNGGEVNQADAAILRERMPLPAIDGYLMAARG
jgi:hypothetical protein